MSLVGGAIRYFPLHICRARIPLGGPTNSLIRSKILLLHQYKFLSRSSQESPPKGERATTGKGWTICR
jgi:hypothetical protein